MSAPPPMKLRQCANLCRDFIDAATPLLLDIHARGDDIEDKAVAMRNLSFCFFRATPYFLGDSLLNGARFCLYFDFPRAFIAAMQDKMAISYADSLAHRISGKDAFSLHHVKRKLPEELRSETALNCIAGRKKAALHALIRNL